LEESWRAGGTREVVVVEEEEAAVAALVSVLYEAVGDEDAYVRSAALQVVPPPHRA